MSTICVDRLKMSRLWQLISKHPQLLLLTSMHGSHLCNILFKLHVLHVSVNPCNSYIQLDMVSYPMFQHQITSSSFTSCFCFHSNLIFTKPRVGLMGTLCSHHLPLRTLLSKCVSFLKTPLFFFSSFGSQNYF